ncbi:MAG: L-serine ammonia-lyase, iron-sulfur-dependent, subunit alpha [Clostridia bacterium]
MKDILLAVLREQVQPATGCTEPVAIALACAYGRAALTGEITEVSLITSKALFKNASSVGIPGTKEKGIEVAAALGLVAGDRTLGLRIFEMMNAADLALAKSFLATGKLKKGYLAVDNPVYVKVLLTTTEGKAEVIIKGKHDAVVSLSVNGIEQINQQQEEFITSNLQLSKYPLEDILTAVASMPLASLEFLAIGVEMNLEVAEYGLKNQAGLGIGAGVQLLIKKGILGNDLLNRIKSWVAAASDARMSGVNLPVMTSCGSGNQGFMITIPLYLVAKENAKTHSELLYALATAHLVNAYIKEFMGKLSPICGCSTSAGGGLAAGIVQLLGGTNSQAAGAVNTLLASLVGTLCDGAKSTCSLKLETAAGEALLYALLAIENIMVEEKVGVVALEIEETFANLGRLSKIGMENTDDIILQIIEAQ